MPVVSSVEDHLKLQLGSMVVQIVQLNVEVEKLRLALDEAQAKAGATESRSAGE